MQAPHKALAGPKHQEEPARAKPFAGRPALISGLAEPAQGHETGVSEVITKESARSQQILQSRQVYEAVLDIVNTRTAVASFRDALITHASAIALLRKTAEPQTTKEEAAEPMKNLGKPATKQEALERALAEAGYKAEVRLVREIDGRAVFSIECGGETCKFPVSDSVMQSDDPVMEVKARLSVLSIGVSSEEMVARQREKNLALLRSTRPPPTPLDIESKELDGRKLHFDGEMAGQWFFTYVFTGTETTFTVSSKATGRDLLEMIDERVDEFHRAMKKPYPASVLEWRAKDRASRPQLQGVPEGLLGIACALDYLSTCPLRMRELVPGEYLDGFDAMKKLAPPYPAFRSEVEKAELDEALGAIDHPISSIMLETFGGGSSRLNASAQEEVQSLLHLVPEVSVDMCDAAVKNVADAYTLISNDSVAVFSTPDELRTKYFRMMFMVRREIEKAVSEGVLEVGL